MVSEQLKVLVKQVLGLPEKVYAVGFKVGEPIEGQLHLELFTDYFPNLDGRDVPGMLVFLSRELADQYAVWAVERGLLAGHEGREVRSTKMTTKKAKQFVRGAELFVGTEPVNLIHLVTGRLDQGRWRYESYPADESN